MSVPATFMANKYTSTEHLLFPTCCIAHAKLVNSKKRKPEGPSCQGKLNPSVRERSGMHVTQGFRESPTKLPICSSHSEFKHGTNYAPNQRTRAPSHPTHRGTPSTRLGLTDNIKMPGRNSVPKSTTHGRWAQTSFHCVSVGRMHACHFLLKLTSRRTESNILLWKPCWP